MMDRNLGALSASYNSSNTEEWGLMYQWGRKDPFLNSWNPQLSNGYISSSNAATVYRPGVLGTSESYLTAYQDNSTVAAVNKNPAYLYKEWYISSSQYGQDDWASDMTDDLWAKEKTIFDPCPAGWQVPDKHVWSGSFMTNLANASLSNGGFNISGIRYPSTAVRLSQAIYISSFKYANGGLIIENLNDYHVFLWAFNGQLHKEKFSYESENGSNPPITPGIYVLKPSSGSEGVPSHGLSYFYRTRAGAVRCLRTGSIIEPSSVSLNKTSVTLQEAQTVQLTASVVPANSFITTITFSSSNPAVATVSETGLVTAVGAGTCSIIATADANEISATCTITVSPTAMTVVDLGLPSGTKWTNINMGATSTSDVGTSYKWGETTPAGDGYVFGSASNPTKYCRSDGKRTMEDEDDAAYVNLGTRYHIPSPDDWTELVENCTATRVTKGTVSGTLFTSTNGASIFIPGAEYWTNKLMPAYYGDYNMGQCRRFGEKYAVTGLEGLLNRDYDYIKIRAVYK